MPLLARISERYTGLFHLSLALFLFLAAPAAFAQPDGKKLFTGNCASCHKVDKDFTGPALKGAQARWEGKGDIRAWVRNSTAVINSGNPYAKELFAKWKNVLMTPQALTDEEIDAIFAYVEAYVPPVPKGPAAPVPGEAPVDDNNWIWLVVLALLFLVVGISLAGVKRGLNNAVREADGLEPEPELPRIVRFRRWAWEHKVFMSFVGLFIFVWLNVKAWDALWVIGVYGGDEVEHYKPEQPIKFDHTLHAGKADKGNLAINCQYCHSSAEKSKHAGIPSTNVCMNCHKAVSEGRTPEGTAEIQKIYDAIGWDGKEFTGKENPIRWVKVHNLPDHAFFSHAQHVAVGKLECQECHGPIDEKMDVAEQWAPLTMGWCVQCHTEKEVNMAGNGYYDEIMARLNEDEKLGHRELKEYLKDGKITVRELGGLECAKCHY